MKKTKVIVVRVIRDCRNGNRDYHLPQDDARRLYNEGKLGFDLTNNCFCELRP